MNLCTTCGDDFGSVRAFNAHRVGKLIQTGTGEYAEHIDDWKPAKGRRCLDTEEMVKKGFVRNAHGTWSIGSDLGRARALRANAGWEEGA